MVSWQRRGRRGKSRSGRPPVLTKFLQACSRGGRGCCCCLQAAAASEVWWAASWATSSEGASSCGCPSEIEGEGAEGRAAVVRAG